MSASVGTVVTGKMSVSEIVSRMIKHIKSGRINPDIRALAGQIVRDIDSRDKDMIAKRVYDFLRLNIKYTNDPRGIEYLQDPIATLKTKTGDCDEFSTLGASLMEAIGVKTRIVIVKQNNSPVWSHVFLNYWSPRFNRWVPFDAIVDQQPGWESPTITSRRFYDIETGQPSGDLGAGEASAAVATWNAAVAATGVGAPVAGAIQAAAAVFDIVSAIGGDAKKALNWFAGKNSILGKGILGIFGSSDRGHLSSRFFLKYFSEAFGPFLNDGDQPRFYDKYISGWHKGKDAKYYLNLNYHGKVYPMRTDRKPNSHQELIEKCADIILRDPERIPPEIRNEFVKVETPKPPVQQQSMMTSPMNQPAQSVTSGGETWPDMPPDPSSIDSFDVTGLVNAKSQIVKTAIALDLKAKSLKLNQSMPTTGVSVLKPDVVNYWKAVKAYRETLINATSGGMVSPEGTVQEAGISWLPIIGIGGAAAALMLKGRR